MDEIDKMLDLRDSLRSAANILDDIIELKDSAAADENITNKCEALLERFNIKMIDIQSLHESL